MIIAYSKLGRSWNLDPQNASTVGGDLDVIRLLMRLAWDHPEHTFFLLGRNSGEDPSRLGYPANVVNPWSEWTMPTVDYESIKTRGAEYIKEYMEFWRAQLAKNELAQGVTQHIMWLGQHGGANSPIPQVGHDWNDGFPLTTPQMAFVNYCSYLADFCNTSYVQPVMLCPDPRNYLKAREFRMGHLGPILGQFDMTRMTKLEQYEKWTTRPPMAECIPTYEPFLPGKREGSLWVTESEYVYAGLEMTALDEPHMIEFARTPGTIPLGLISNENRKEVGRLARLPLVLEWLLAQVDDPDSIPIFGKWTPESEKELGREGGIASIPTHMMYETLRSFRCTVTFPASGSGWATAKPWEAFAAGTVMFFHPEYDVQGNILPLPGKPHWTDQYGKDVRGEVQTLSNFLRVTSPEELHEKVKGVTNDDVTWDHIAVMQRDYFELAFQHWRGGARKIEEAIGL
jgi:hypothetical protein